MPQHLFANEDFQAVPEILGRSILLRKTKTRVSFGIDTTLYLENSQLLEPYKPTFASLEKILSKTENLDKNQRGKYLNT